MPKILIVYYSMYGHIATMAKEIAKGVEASGAEVVIKQVPETLPAEVLTMMHAPPKDADVPVATTAELPEYDGIMIGVPTRFGMAAAQMKAFFDATGGLWQKGALVGKPAALFFSTATQGGGQETTALTFLTQFTHHGMVFVPLGYSTPLLFNMDEVHGSSPYGAGTFAGADGSRQPSDLEKSIAVAQGTHFGKIATALAAGYKKMAALEKKADGGEEHKAEVLEESAKAAQGAAAPASSAAAAASVPAPTGAASSGKSGCSCILS